MVLPPDWHVTPVGVGAVLLLGLHSIGLRRLANRQSPRHRYLWWRRSLAFRAGLVVLILIVSGPSDRYAMKWLSIHMVLHVVEMFYLPPLLILGAGWTPLVHVLPIEERRRWLRWYYRGNSARPLRALAAGLSRPVVAIVAFNAVMVFWHLPVIYDYASWHQWVMDWLMAPSFLVSGYLFWRCLLAPFPYSPRARGRMQVAAVVITALEMLVIAMSMSILTRAPWYSMNLIMDGRSAALRDQDWAAGILWVCGDLWAVPALVLIGYRVYAQHGSLSDAFERALGRA